jgi:1-deoxy-D-xylulose-5-phosphate synthase
VEYKLLDGIRSPGDLKRLPVESLPELAGEIRHFLVEHVTKTGGHLASNLGVVELTIALHYVFNSPDDRLIWDTGHQSYVHKLLTGRREGFDSLRQLDGMSGFPRADESEHDIFNTGHASTSIAAALGMSNADDSRWTIAIIGDGALTGGLALTGLNNADLARKRFLVVLNDNGMSIDPNVGTMARYLSTIKTKAKPRAVNQALRRLLSRVFGPTSTLRDLYERMKDNIFYSVIPRKSQGVVFEELGFSYFGPYNGHDVASLVKLFDALKHIKDEPLLAHVITRKGCGYGPAEASPVKWHGVPEQIPLGIEEDRLDHPNEDERRAVKTYTEIFVDTLIELAPKHPEMVAITAAMPSGTGTRKFAELYPDRFFDVGISEEFAVTFACGLAKGGKRPVCAIYSTFLQRAFDQLIHDAALQHLPVIFALDRGGIVGADGETHQGVFDLSYLRMIPNFTVMAPKDEEELRRMMVTALTHTGGPTAIRFPRGGAVGVPLSADILPIPLGSWEILRDGNKAVLLAVGTSVQEALSAAKLLEERGISTAVVNARFIRPIDKDMLLSLARRIPLFVTVEENVTAGGFGSGVLELLTQQGVSVPQIRLLGLPDRFIEHGTPKELRKRYHLDAESIAQQVAADITRLERKYKIV